MQGKAWHTDGPRLGEQRRDDDIVFEAMAGGTVFYSLATRYFTCRDGRVIEIREAAAPLRDGKGMVRGAVCAFWKRTDEQSAERAKVDFINLAGHQLNNKLSAMIWAAEQLRRPDVSDPFRKQLLEIVSETLADLRDFNKQFVAFQREHAQQPIVGAEVNLAPYLKSKIGIWRMTHPTHRFRLSGDFKPVAADAMRLNVVLDNLLENAVKYSPRGSLITVRGIVTGIETQEITIHNGGEPIPPELLAVLFERWQRGDSLQPGSGLGLWLARTKLHEMGGDIRVTSRPRRGTTFFVTLKRALRPGLSEANLTAATWEGWHEPVWT
jgi:signal transduction histidine kinase